MRKFDTKIQYLKYKVLREVARYGFEDNLDAAYYEIPKLIVKEKPTMRCCIYKERAIVEERIKLAMGGDKKNPNVIEVIEIACDECPVSGHVVTESCRGCLAHRCEDVCRRGAITFDEQQKAHIDKSKCVECGQCAKVCPYSAIINQKRPCEKACKIKAISMSSEEHRAAHIDNEKCISCGACVYQCPFGAIVDKSFILDAVNLIKGSHENQDYKVYAVVAPSISSQFSYAKLGQVITGIQRLGFYHVIEAALGADMVAYKEAAELAEKGFLTSSCCPAFVSYIKKNFPTMVDKISHNLSPAAEIGRYIKETTPGAKVVFIGPCAAKKLEASRRSVRSDVDFVLTFEELRGMFEAKNIDFSQIPDEQAQYEASAPGVGFAASGGVAKAVEKVIEKLEPDRQVKTVYAEGLRECRQMLRMARTGKYDGYLLEGMACPGGCIAGAGTVQPPEKSRRLLEQYKAQAPKSNPVESDYTEYLQIIREDEENWDPVARH